MKGHVDQAGRAMLTLTVKATDAGTPADLTAWVDTAFDGELVAARTIIQQLQLPQSAAVEATLADGQIVTLETYSCLLDWFGSWRSVEVVANDGRFPLLGVGLLRRRKLTIDYDTNALTLE